MGFQQIQVIGKLGKDPELRYSKSGMAVVNFSVAVGKKSKGEEQTTWFRCVAFDKSAELISQYFVKGNEIHIVGEMKFDSYEDKNGTKVNTADLIVNQFTFLSGNKSEKKAPPSRNSNDAPPASDGFIDDDLPFARLEGPLW